MQQRSVSTDLARLLVEADAFDVSLGEPHKYASGVLSPVYTNCRRLASYPGARKRVSDWMVDAVRPVKDKIDIIASAGTGSIFVASLMAERLAIPMIFVRPKPKVHGKMKQIEGVLNAGDKVLLVSDILSTEEDIPRSVECIRSCGGEVIQCLALFDNKMDTVDAFLRQQHIPYSTLSDIVTLIDVASSQGRITEEEARVITEWTRHPTSWSENRKTAERLISENRVRIAKILLGIGAVSINSEKPFKYTSGLLGPIYTDNRLLISHPREWKVVIDGFVSVLRNRIGTRRFDTLAGTAISGIPHATLVADRLNVPLIYVRLDKGDSSENPQIEGLLKKGDRVVVIEDHVTTGGSVVKTVQALRNSGAEVRTCVAIFTYDFEKSRPIFQKENIDFMTLCDLPTLMKVALENGKITEKDQREVTNWLENPEFWAAERRGADTARAPDRGPRDTAPS